MVAGRGREWLPRSVPPSVGYEVCSLIEGLGDPGQLALQLHTSAVKALIWCWCGMSERARKHTLFSCRVVVAVVASLQNVCTVEAIEGATQDYDNYN